LRSGLPAGATRSSTWNTCTASQGTARPASSAKNARGVLPPLTASVARPRAATAFPSRSATRSAVRVASPVSSGRTWVSISFTPASCPPGTAPTPRNGNCDGTEEERRENDGRLDLPLTLPGPSGLFTKDFRPPHRMSVLGRHPLAGAVKISPSGAFPSPRPGHGLGGLDGASEPLAVVGDRIAP